jgi:aquaporin Z
MTDTALTTTTTTAPTIVHKFAAEVLGTFVLVFFGVGTALATGGEVITTGLAFGLTVLVMAYAVGRISGGHFNPAVTVGAAIGGRLAWSQVPLYVGAQLVGALLGGGVLWGIYQGIPGFSSDGAFGQNAFGDQSSNGLAWWAALLVEAVTTFVFLLVILAVTDERNQHPALAPLAIGLALAMIHFTTINLTGTSVNPARSIGAGVFAGGDAILQLWLFIVAPLLGAGISGLVYPAVFGHATEPVPGSGLRLGRRGQPGAVPGYGAPDAYQQQWNQQQYPAQQPWPPQPPQWQQPQYPTGPAPQAWPQQAPPQQPPPQQPAQQPPGQQPPPQGQPGQHPPQAPPWQQPWPGSDGEDGQTQVRPPT